MAPAILAGALLVLLVAVTVTDLRRRVVPDRALVPAVVVALSVLAVAHPEGLPERLGAAAGAGGFLLAAALARPDGMGMGDVKLAAVLGLYLGPAVAPALLVALLAGACWGVTLILRHGPGARSRTIPFAPFLALGALVALPGAAIA